MWPTLNRISGTCYSQLVKLATGRGELVATEWGNPLIEVTCNNKSRVLSVASFTKLTVYFRICLFAYGPMTTNLKCTVVLWARLPVQDTIAVNLIKIFVRARDNF